jgi:hypothetical protein
VSVAYVAELAAALQGAAGHACMCQHMHVPVEWAGVAQMSSCYRSNIKK